MSECDNCGKVPNSYPYPFDDNPYDTYYCKGCFINACEGSIEEAVERIEDIHIATKKMNLGIYKT